ncbi:MAG: hypothetical protein KJ737_00825 [Proteobacteria bacterium]|nr:hypothetical protein [Pseudomonadota bacterium]
MKTQSIDLTIKILGNGGAINKGLPYNSFIINDSLLCELPPDIMLSLHRNKVHLSLIDTIYISHLHGDHIFGLPFLVLSAFFNSERTGDKSSFSLIGPNGLEELAHNLVISAFTKSHPCLSWMQKFCRFFETDASGTPNLTDGYETSLFKLDHMMETFGFLLADSSGKGASFAYIADTLWCESVLSVIEKKPRLVLIDLNGSLDDLKPVHLSMAELIEKGIPVAGNQSTFLGTHLREPFSSELPQIVCAEPGMTVVVPSDKKKSVAIGPPAKQFC